MSGTREMANEFTTCVVNFIKKTIPDYHYSKIYKVIIDVDYWRNKDPKFPEDALVWFTDGSRTDSGMGDGIYSIRPKRALASLWVNSPQFFKLKSMPLFNAHMKT